MQVLQADPDHLEVRFQDGARIVLAESAAKVIRLIQDYRPDIFAGVGSAEHLADVLAMVCYHADPATVGSVAQFRGGLARCFASCQVD